ncbi:MULTISPECIES: 30S ribosomal protein S17 [Jonquetella]|uniref:Small ribosomal subunit protein uS17 n=1 Tax=Jonquetella anthropi DSM 22815 TaxID=885272 RepID=H0UL95_9BACT|nr:MULTISPECIES: 30S ribosomal protein S17 [Jonquetella]EEX48016.1 30S ribosomal protein S17 [Jonquetella anthropi E3_33 E1]EHM13454.1 30S ribosomal protein S17 [Jonquetella anthropi DSM 22815]ERL24314.1 30S ribosomal protein S17 [Jonquetella sp. BV3C21]
MEGKALHHHKVKVGVVESDKMEKSVSVRVTRHAMHPVYGKRMVTSKKFVAHDESNDCHVGDRVLIEECRPLSRTKHWKVVRVIERALALDGEEKEEA